MKDVDDKKYKKYMTLIASMAFLIIIATAVTTYAFFNFTRIGAPNTIETGTVIFDYVDTSTINIGNVFPIDQNDIDSSYEATFTITAHNTIANGVEYNIYAVPGDAVAGKTRLADSAVKMQFVPAADGNGFTTTVNNYSSATTPVFTNGKALISTGLVRNTTSATTKSYTVKLWISSDNVFVSSTTKRANNAEGNPSLADATTGTTTATRYMKNDTSEASIVTLYPAKPEAQGKTIYTTNEFCNSYYSIKIMVEAYDKKTT